MLKNYCRRAKMFNTAQNHLPDVGRRYIIPEFTGINAFFYPFSIDKSTLH